MATFAKLTPTECGYCKIGHRRRRGIHVPSQRVGMIREAPCLFAWAVDLTGGGRSPDPQDGKRWVGYYRDAHGVHQVVLRNGTTRRFKTPTGATSAARGFLKDEG